MIILARFQIPALKSVFRQVQDGYVIKRAQKGRFEEIKGGNIRKFPGPMGLIRIYSKNKIPDSKVRF